MEGVNGLEPKSGEKIKVLEKAITILDMNRPTMAKSNAATAQ